MNPGNHLVIGQWMVRKGLGLQCTQSSLNLTFAAMLLSGPTADMTPQQELLYTYYAPEDEFTDEHQGGSNWQAHNRALRIHVDFLIELLCNIFEPWSLQSKGHEMMDKDATCLMLRIFELAIRYVTPHVHADCKEIIRKGKVHAESLHARDYITHYITYFSDYLLHMLHHKPGYTQRGSVVLRGMKSVQISNLLANSIPDDGLWCTSLNHSFEEWISYHNSRNWQFSESQQSGTQSGIHSSSDIHALLAHIQKLVLEYKYHAFLRSVCRAFAVEECRHAFAEDLLWSPLRHSNVPFHLRLDALSGLKDVIVKRLFQLEQEALALKQPLNDYLRHLATIPYPDLTRLPLMPAAHDIPIDQPFQPLELTCEKRSTADRSELLTCIEQLPGKWQKIPSRVFVKQLQHLFTHEN